MCRRCGEPDRRPNAAGRRRLRQRLLDAYGDGEKVECSWQFEDCTGPLTIATMELDRITTGQDGGTYRFDNIVPACGPCNRARAFRDPDKPEDCSAGMDWPEWHPKHPRNRRY